MHHFEQAKQKQEQIAASTSSGPIDPKKVTIDLESQTSKELKSRFEKRVSPDLFLKLFTFCDAQSLVKLTSVSKTWKDSILGSSELFRSFKMEGTGKQLCEGLELFSRRNEDSTKNVFL